MKGNIFRMSNALPLHVFPSQAFIFIAFGKLCLCRGKKISIQPINLPKTQCQFLCQCMPIMTVSPGLSGQNNENVCKQRGNVDKMDSKRQ